MLEFGHLLKQFHLQHIGTPNHFDKYIELLNLSDFRRTEQYNNHFVLELLLHHHYKMLLLSLILQLLQIAISLLHGLIPFTQHVSWLIQISDLYH